MCGFTCESSIKENMMLEIYQYDTSPAADWMLLQWMERMRRDGELDHTLSCGNGTPSRFLAFFQSRRLFFTVDDFGNLTRACWIEPCMGSVFLSYYVSPDVRADQKEKVFFLFDIVNEIFNMGVPVIVGLIQERDDPKDTQRFVDLHERLGYSYAGVLDGFFDGKDCHLVQYKRSVWESWDNGWQKRWRADRGYPANAGESQGDDN